jgi:hypothetical protein
MILVFEGDNLAVRLAKMEKVWTLHGDFSIPVSHIARVSKDAPQTVWREWRAPGTFVPYLIKAGTYYTPRGKEFWYMTRWREPVVLELTGEPYQRMIIGLPPAEQEAWLEKLLTLKHS